MTPPSPLTVAMRTAVLTSLADALARASKPKTVQDRFVSAPADDDAPVQPAKATKTAEVQTGGVAPAAEKPVQPEK